MCSLDIRGGVRLGCMVDVDVDVDTDDGWNFGWAADRLGPGHGHDDDDNDIRRASNDYVICGNVYRSSLDSGERIWHVCARTGVRSTSLRGHCLHSYSVVPRR